MIEALSTPSNRMKTFIFLGLCGLLAGAAVAIGIDDNPPGGLLALLAAIAFVLAFAHPWRTTRKYIMLLIAAVLGFVLFIIVSIISDSILQDPSGSVVLKNLIESPANEAFSVIFAMICAAAFCVGAVGSLVMLIRGRRQSA